MLLYIHYPFCRSKCSYCGFCSRVWDQELEELYLSALFREARFWGSRLDRPRISTLYIGGGTPSLMRPWILERLAEEIEHHFILADDLEFSLEANPDSLNPERARSLARLGVNRMSIGVQSLDGVQLRLLERPHDAEQAFRAVDELRSAGIDNVGLDLLWGLP
ncbi:MAG: radical SAM protein, partial [Desulfohalobiaceae bacterium]